MTNEIKEKICTNFYLVVTADGLWNEKREKAFQDFLDFNEIPKEMFDRIKINKSLKPIPFSSEEEMLSLPYEMDVFATNGESLTTPMLEKAWEIVVLSGYQKGLRLEEWFEVGYHFKIPRV